MNELIFNPLVTSIVALFIFILAPVFPVLKVNSSVIVNGLKLGIPNSGTPLINSLKYFLASVKTHLFNSGLFLLQGVMLAAEIFDKYNTYYQFTGSIQFGMMKILTKFCTFHLKKNASGK